MEIQIACMRCKKPVTYTENPVWPGTPSDTMTYAVAPCCIPQRYLPNLNNINNILENLLDESFVREGHLKDNIREAIDDIAFILNTDE